MDPVLVGFGDQQMHDSVVQWGQAIAALSNASLQKVSLAELESQVDEHHPSMVVLGERDALDDDGSLALHLLEHGHTLAVVPDTYESLEGGRFVVGIDGTRANAAALTRAAQLTRAAEGTLTAVFAYEPLDDTFVLPAGWHRHSDEVRAEVRRVRTVPIELLMEPGTPADVLCDVATREHAAAVIVGTRTRKGFRRRGAEELSTRLAHKGACPTIAVPHRAQLESRS